LAPFNEPMTTLAYLAAVTPLELVTGVLVLPQRSTAVVAKDAAQIDLLSGGKLRLGVSIGWNRAEFAALGADFATRGRRFVEQVELLRRYWSDELVFFDGEFHQAHGVALAPRPVQQPIPLWFGGASPEHGSPKPRLLDRIARLADGWYLDAGVEPTATTAAAVDELHRLRSRHGRSGDAFGIDARINLARVSCEDVAEVAVRWRDLGVTHLTIDTRNAERAGWPASTTGANPLECVAETLRRAAAVEAKREEGHGQP
jgi:probable F420-dependent oxidoreductase